MTTLTAGRKEALVNLSSQKNKDPVYYQKMVDQLCAITLGSNPYYVWESLSPEEKGSHESLENHPMGYELCGMRWVIMDAMTIWGNSWKPHDEVAHAQAA